MTFFLEKEEHEKQDRLRMLVQYAEEGLQTQQKAEVTKVLQKQKKKTGVLTLQLSI